jgi:hypothetical protein
MQTGAIGVQARAAIKEIYRSHRLASEYSDTGSGFFYAIEPAAVLSDSEPGIWDLPCTGFAAQLDDQLVYLSQTRCADRMTFRFQPA